MPLPGNRFLTILAGSCWTSTTSFNGSRPSGNYDWTLEGDGITISLGAPGFTQYLRRPPVHCPRHALSAEERGGFGFDRFGYTP
jgi:hypothetical protein